MEIGRWVVGSALAAGMLYARGRRAVGQPELHVYDFDGTLFRSPHSPAIWDKDWWSDPASLLPPCVPVTPSGAWWISPVARSASRSISDPNVFAIMMTGRKAHSAFRYRVPELLKQKGLNFDAVHLDEGSGDSLKGKLDTIFRYLRHYPFIDTVRIWDDRPSHLWAFKQQLQRKDYTVYTEHVQARALDPLCEEQDFTRKIKRRKPAYVGVFLDARSKAALVNAYPFRHDKVKNNHVTLGYKLTPELNALLGMPVRMKVVGYAEDDLGQAVVVTLLDEVPSKGVPHITLTHASSVKAKYSNDLIAEGYKRVSGPVLTGIIDTFPSSFTRAK